MGLAPTAAVAKARRENKAWNQNKGGDARVERSSTAAVTGMMSRQDWWTAGTKGEHHREDLDISGRPKRRRTFPKTAEGWNIWSSQSTNPGTGLGEPQRGLPIQLEDIPPQRRRNYRVSDLSVLNLYHCNNVSIISRQHRNRNRTAYELKWLWISLE